jgi:hypothetical protein
MTYQLEKYLWTDADFPQMGWHDCNIYQLKLEAGELILDIDYILQWNQPDIEGMPFTFWISPATLVFSGVDNVSFDLGKGFDGSLEIDGIELNELEAGKHWTIITQQGDMQFNATGYQQFIRQEPFLKFGQVIPYIERYGYSIERTTTQHNPNRYEENMVQQRKKELEDYEMTKSRHLKRRELEQLLLDRENNTLDLKTYLLKKKEISELIFSYDFYLKGTLFEHW